VTLREALHPHVADGRGSGFGHNRSKIEKTVGESRPTPENNRASAREPF
jgi:hypothetical protein